MTSKKNIRKIYRAELGVKKEKKKRNVNQIKFFVLDHSN